MSFFPPCFASLTLHAKLWLLNMECRLILRLSGCSRTSDKRVTKVRKGGVDLKYSLPIEQVEQQISERPN